MSNLEELMKKAYAPFNEEDGETKTSLEEEVNKLKEDFRIQAGATYEDPYYDLSRLTTLIDLKESVENYADKKEIESKMMKLFLKITEDL